MSFPISARFLVCWTNAPCADLDATRHAPAVEDATTPYVGEGTGNRAAGVPASALSRKPRQIAAGASLPSTDRPAASRSGAGRSWPSQTVTASCGV
jgi:hypothetical protein